MITMKPTRYEIYAQALAQLAVAVEALDQAHASMRDAQVDDVATTNGTWPGPMTVTKLRISATGLLNALHHAECEDCGLPYSLHGGIPDILEPIGCKWGRS